MDPCQPIICCIKDSWKAKATNHAQILLYIKLQRRPHHDQVLLYIKAQIQHSYLDLSILSPLCIQRILSLPWSSLWSQSYITILWGDNRAALLHSTTDPPWLTPKSKSIAVEYYWFQEHLKEGETEMHPVASALNRSNILTKLFLVCNSKLNGTWSWVFDANTS